MNIEALNEIASLSNQKVLALEAEIDLTQRQWEAAAAGEDVVEADTLEAALIVLQQDLRRSKVKALKDESNLEQAKAEAIKAKGQQAADACIQIEQNLASQLAAIQAKSDELCKLLTSLQDTFASGWEGHVRTAKECGVRISHAQLIAPQFNALRAQLARPEGIVSAFQMRRDL